MKATPETTFTCFPDHVQDLEQATPTVQAVLLAIVRLAREQGDGRECAPLRQQIAELAHVSIGTVSVSMRRLVELGAIEFVKDSTIQAGRRVRLLWRRTRSRASAQPTDKRSGARQARAAPGTDKPPGARQAQGGARISHAPPIKVLEGREIDVPPKPSQTRNPEPKSDQLVLSPEEIEATRQRARCRGGVGMMARQVLDDWGVPHEPGGPIPIRPAGASPAPPKPLPPEPPPSNVSSDKGSTTVPILAAALDQPLAGGRSVQGEIHALVGCEDPAEAERLARRMARIVNDPKAITVGHYTDAMEMVRTGLLDPGAASAAWRDGTGPEVERKKRPNAVSEYLGNAMRAARRAQKPPRPGVSWQSPRPGRSQESV